MRLNEGFEAMPNVMDCFSHLLTSSFLSRQELKILYNEEPNVLRIAFRTP